MSIRFIRQNSELILILTPEWIEIQTILDMPKEVMTGEFPDALL